MDFYFQSRSSLEKQLVEFIYHKNYSEAIKIALYLEVIVRLYHSNWLITSSQITEENDNFSIYPITLALLIAVQKIEEAKALWDRCPVQIRNSDQALVKLLELANSISNQNFKKSYQLLSSIWPQTIESIIDSIRVEYFHQQLFLISIMFRTISLTDMLERTNIASKEELLSGKRTQFLFFFSTIANIAIHLFIYPLVCANLDWSVVDAGQDTIQPIQLVHPKPLRNNSTCDIFAGIKWQEVIGCWPNYSLPNYFLQMPLWFTSCLRTLLPWRERCPLSPR